MFLQSKDLSNQDKGNLSATLLLEKENCLFQYFAFFGRNGSNGCFSLFMLLLGGDYLCIYFFPFTMYTPGEVIFITLRPERS